MFIERDAFLYALFLMAILINNSIASKCGDYFCGENAECSYNKKEEKLNCDCLKGYYRTNLKDNINVACSSQEIIKCSKVGDECGPKHKCNANLFCEKINGDIEDVQVEGIKTISGYMGTCSAAQQCQEECCGENEKCENLQCVPKETEKSLDGTLKYNDDTENLSLALKRDFTLNEDVACSKSQLCLDKCCGENEICASDKCVSKQKEELTGLQDTIIKENPADDTSNCPKHQCLNKCCAANEKCENDKCVPQKTSIASVCPQTELCGSKCCPENEICNEDKECVPYLEVPTISNCPEQQKCLEICCSPQEACNEFNKCVNKNLLDVANLYNFSEESANAVEVIPNNNCPMTQKCLDNCCSPLEVCNELKKCVSKNLLDVASLYNFSEESANAVEVIPNNNCPKEQTCLENCCSPLEVCNEFKKCVNKNLLDVANLYNFSEESANAVEVIPNNNCPKEQTCLENCCSPLEVCNEFKKCVNKNLLDVANLYNFSEESANAVEVIPNNNCPKEQKCLENCCSPQEVCNEFKKCVNKNLLDVANLYNFSEESGNAVEVIPNNNCPKVQKCFENCCSPQEVCNEFHKCVNKGLQDLSSLYDFSKERTENSDDIEATIITNCPLPQKCLAICCSPHEVCSELNECVNKNQEDISNLYDFSNELAVNKTENSNAIDAAVIIYDLNKNEINCPTVDQVCQDKCCTTEQICNNNGECVTNVKAYDCALGENCFENAEDTYPKATLAYIGIGSGCIVAALGFLLFKLYNFRRSQRNLY